MRIAKQLSITWTLYALASVIISICWMFPSVQKFFDAVISLDVIVGFALAAWMLMLYGANYHILTRNNNFFRLKSLLPAACPNLYIVPFTIYLASIWGDWNDPDTPWIWIVMVAITIFVILGITVFGWIKRLPKAYLLALGIAGVAATVCHLSILISFTVVPCPDGMAGVGRALLAFVSFFYAALPGLWASLACFLAIFLDASPRKKNAVPPRFAERVADATIKDGKSGARG